MREIEIEEIFNVLIEAYALMGYITLCRISLRGYKTFEKVYMPQKVLFSIRSISLQGFTILIYKIVYTFYSGNTRDLLCVCGKGQGSEDNGVVYFIVRWLFRIQLKGAHCESS